MASQSSSPSLSEPSTLERVRKLLDKAKANANRPPLVLPPPPSVEWRPSSGADTQHQEMMIFYYTIWGIRGLNRYLANRAEAVIEDLSGTDSSYQRIYDDFHRNANAAEYYLASLHRDTLSAVLDGTFFYRQTSDPEFKARVEYTTKLAPVPGVYLVGWARSAHAKDHAGKGVTLNELVQIHGLMKRYIDLDDTSFQSTARDIDGAIPFRGCQDQDYTINRRYEYPGHSQFGAIETWLEYTQSEYLDFYDNWQRKGCPGGWSPDEPMVRVLVYCGWGILTSNRAQSHESHPPSESPLYGLFSAILVYLFGDRFEFRAMQLFRCFDNRDCALIEILGHDIASSRSTDGGLNGASPGGIGANPATFAGPNYNLVWEYNRNFMRGTGLVPANLQDNVARYKRMQEILAAIPTIDNDMTQVKTNAQKLLKDVEKLVERTETLEIIRSIEKLDEAIAEFERNKSK